MFKLTPPHLISPRRAGALAAVAAAAALAAAPAGASVDSTVAAGPNGGAQLVFIQQAAGGYGQAHERTLGGDGSLSTMQTVTFGYRHVLRHRVGTDAGGNAVIAWTSLDPDGTIAYARRRTADGGLSATLRVSPAGVTVSNLQLAVEPDGDAIMVWSRVLSGKNVVQARRRTAGGTLGPIRTLSYVGGESLYPDVAVAPDGAATVVWVRATSGRQFLQSRTLAPDDSLGEFERLSADSQAVADPMVTVSNTGTAVVGWTRDTDDGFVFEARARAATGSLGAIQTIAAADAFDKYPTLASNAAGRSVFAWSQEDAAAGEHTLKGRIRRADGTLGAEFDFARGKVTEPCPGIDPNGNTTLAWRLDASVDQIQTRRRTAAGTLGTVRTLSDTTVNSSFPRLAVDSGGTATVAWNASGAYWAARTVTPGGTLSPIHRLDAAGG